MFVIDFRVWVIVRDRVSFGIRITVIVRAIVIIAIRVRVIVCLLVCLFFFSGGMV